MHHVLLIERSATFRHTIDKLLRKGKFKVSCADTFEKGLLILTDISNGRARFDGIIIGWPERTDPSADEILVYLNTNQLSQTPKLILSEDGDPAKLDWITKNQLACLLPWLDYTRSVSELNRLIEKRDDLTQPLQKPEKQPIRIMIVDDSPASRFNFRRVLEHGGYTVETASSVDEGFELATSKPFDIAIIDYFMPDGNGDFLVKRLKQDVRTKNLVSCILTASYSDQVTKDCLEAGAMECMFKSESQELFLARVKALSLGVKDRRSIENERRYLKNILGSVGDGVYGVDKNGTIEFVNQAVCRILGYKASSDLIGKSAQEIFHHLDQNGKSINKNDCQLSQCYLEGNYLTNWRTVFWNSVGSSMHVECTVFPIVADDVCKGSVVAFRDISDRKSFEEELRWQATHDPLTKLPNRTYFEDQLEVEVNRLRRCSESSALLFIDLDRFKYINDTAGHAVGDQVLVDICERLRVRLRSSDVLARISGDEFALILRGIGNDKEKVFSAADDFRRVVEDEEFYCLGKIYNMTITIGVDIIDKNRNSAGEAMSNADLACYIAKSKGRNQTHIFSSEHDNKTTMDMELGWSTRLRNALKNDLFVLSYQPIISMHAINAVTKPNKTYQWQRPDFSWNKEHANYEVLIRLQEPDGSLVLPNAFLPTAERFDLITDIDKWVIDHALKTLSEQLEQGNEINFSINLSAQAISDGNLSTYIREKLELYRVTPGRVMFEITETGALTNINAAKELIAELRKLGCRFALDDFGSGFSSFTHLKHLDVDVIKIDGQFVRGAVDNSVDRAVIFAVTQIAHTLGKRTVAEYVDSIEILSALLAAGVDYVQGYHIGKPFFGLNREHVEEIQALTANGSFCPEELLISYAQSS